MRIIGTRDEIREALDALDAAYSLPREPQSVTGGAPPFAGVRTSRYSVAERLSDGRWSAPLDAAAVAVLSPALAALVAADLPEGVSVVSSSAWMRPVVVRAVVVDLPQDMPVGEGIEHLWDTSEPDPLGTRYVRADGERLFVVQQIANSTDHVFVLWFGGDSADPNETDYSRAMILAATAAGVVLESVECVYDSGAWLVGEMAEGSTIASRWPASWRVWQPGDVANPSGARCIREVALVS